MPSSKISQPLKVLITSGPTAVSLDPVRVLTNRSTGEMGRLLAAEFLKAGGKVTLLEGRVSCEMEVKGVRTVRFFEFDELERLFKSELKKNYDVVIHAAAVSDFKPAVRSRVKISSSRTLTLRLIATPKLVNAIKKLSPHSLLVGFKLEDSIRPSAISSKIRRLFADSKADLVVANTLTEGYQGTVVRPDFSRTDVVTTKRRLVKVLVKEIDQILHAKCLRSYSLGETK